MTNLSSVVRAIGDFYGFLIIAYVLMSWIPMRGDTITDIYGVLASLVEPYLGVFRRFIPPMGGMDFSPIVGIIVLQFLVRGLAGLLA